MLSDLGSFYESIPFEYLLIGHCLLVASWFPKLKDKFLLSYWVRSTFLPIQNQNKLAPSLSEPYCWCRLRDVTQFT